MTPAEILTLLPESTPVCVHLWFGPILFLPTKTENLMQFLHPGEA